MRNIIRVGRVVLALAASPMLAGACSDAAPQQPSPSILVNPRAVGVPTSGTTGSTLTVVANVAWTATTDSPAATITSGAAGDGNGTITYDVAANPGAQRTFHIFVSGNTAVGTVTLTQVGTTAR